MMLRDTASGELACRSSVPGRQRWRVAAVHRDAGTAERLVACLRLDPRVRSVSANAHTGGVLVSFDPGAGLDVASLIRSALLRLAGKPCCETLEAAPEPTDKGHAARAEPLAKAEGHMVRLLDRVGADRGELRRATATPVLAAVAAFLPNIAFAALTSTAQLNGSSLLRRAGIRGAGAQMLVLGGLVAASFGVQILVEYASKKRWHRLASKLENQIKVATFDHVQRLDMAYIDEQSTGRLMSVIVEDAGSVRKYYEDGYTDVVRKIATGVIINGMLFSIAPGLGLLPNLTIPMLVLITRYFKPRTAVAHREAGVARGEFSRALNDNLAGIPVIKSFTNEDLEVERLRELDRERIEANERVFEADYAQSESTRMLFYWTWTSTIVYASYLLTQRRVSNGVFDVLLFSVPQLITAMFGLEETTKRYREANSAAERILEILDVETEVVDGGDDLIGVSRGELRFEQVEFTYPGRPVKVLDNLDLELGRGLTAIVGGSGSGKTTIAKLLLRFYDVGAGRVTLDGRDIRELTLRSLRAQVGYVSQEPYLFPATIEDNIRYARPDASIDEVREAAARAEIAEFIESLPDGYQTRLGERGARLSGGQRQRVCIARALLARTPILICDEPSAAVDNEIELALQRSLARLGEDHTVVLIAHRLASVHNADRIVVLEGGRIAEDGTHDELLERRGLYASLWRVQSRPSVS